MEEYCQSRDRELEAELLAELNSRKTRRGRGSSETFEICAYGFVYLVAYGLVVEPNH